jgi:hypothetical protein
MPKAKWSQPCRVADLGGAIADGKSTARRPITSSHGLTAVNLAVWLVRMKRPPNPPILAATEANGSFIELAFLPFDIADADFRPAWAERGKRRNAWNSLSEVERRVALRLLKVKMPRQLIAGARPATIADVRKHQHSCLRKLGCDSVADLLGLHREFALKFEQRAWAACHPGDR